jgi:hypothetical protein
VIRFIAFYPHSIVLLTNVIVAGIFLRTLAATPHQAKTNESGAEEGKRGGLGHLREVLIDKARRDRTGRVIRQQQNVLIHMDSVLVLRQICLERKGSSGAEGPTP